jgi:GAF domain-containing protein
MYVSFANDWRALDTLIAASVLDIETVCTAIGGMLGVDRSCVGLLKIRGLTLEFVYPIELKSAGRIPLSSSAVAARTASSKQAELFNNFAKVSHNSVFELVPLGGPANADPQRIQKLMSAPVVDGAGKALGVIQISRKGPTRDAAGPDFTEDELANLSKIGKYLATLVEKL